MSCIGDRCSHDDEHIKAQQPSLDVLLKVYRSIPFMIVELDKANKCVVNVSPQCESIFGLKPDDVVGKTIHSLLVGRDDWKVQELFANVMCVATTIPT